MVAGSCNTLACRLLSTATCLPKGKEHLTCKVAICQHQQGKCRKGKVCQGKVCRGKVRQGKGHLDKATTKASTIPRVARNSTLNL